MSQMREPLTAARPSGAGPSDPGTPPAAAGTHRLAWLDALRGIAAICVVFDHLTYYVLQHARADVYQWFNPGDYGVFVFFMISGYIVPASLERKGSVRTFWVSRIFRLYPLYLLAVGLAVGLYFVHLGGLRGAGNDPETSILAQLLMMSNVLDGPNLPNVVWSLSYEMIFYLLLTALFTARVHRRSSWFALAFAVAAVAVGGVLPQVYFSSSLSSPRLVALIADMVVLAGLAVAVVLRGVPRRMGAVIAAAVAVVLLAFNGGWIFPWEALSILALMFTGTMLYRADQGQYPWYKAIGFAVSVIVLAIAAGLWHSHAWGMSAHSEWVWERRWLVDLSLAGATMGAGLLFRRFKVPRALSWLGMISYSVYLLHPLLIEIYYHLSWTKGHHSFAVQVIYSVGFFLVVIAVSSVTYITLERPAQRLGYRVAKWLDKTFGPDQVPESEPRHAVASARGRPVTQ